MHTKAVKNSHKD